MPSLQGWSHITWPVSDLARSEEWYLRVIGGEVVTRQGMSEHERAVGRTKQIFIRTPGGAVINIAEGEPMHRPDDMHFYHYAFQGGGLEALDEWLTHLRDQGVKPLGPYVHGNAGSVSVYFDDPDNYRLEITFQVGTFEDVKRLAPKRDWKMGNPVHTYPWKD